MPFERDEAKNHRNIDKHGLDFRDVLAAFADENPVVVPDLRKDYGDVRHIMLAEAQGRIPSIVFTVRGDNIRLISARTASRREKERYARGESS